MWSLSVVCLVLPIFLVVSNVAAIPILPFNETRADDVGYRLPNNTRPVTYDIRLTTNIHREDLAFTGVAIIDLEILQSTSSIYLHARQIKVTSATIWLAWQESYTYPVTLTYDEVTEFLVAEVPAVLLPGGVYRLTLNYEGSLRTDGGGFYRQFYKNSLGENVYLATTQFESTNARHAFPCYDEPQKKAIFKISITHGSTYNAVSNMPVMKLTEKYLATTHFQATDARHAFPCYDEPQLKAVFRIKITHHKSYTAISNMPVLGELIDNNDGTTTTSFEPTTLMSTYLVAFTVSDYTYSRQMDRVEHRVYSKPNYEKQHQFALQTSIAVLNSLEDYLGFAYPLTKMDNVAIPSKGGAMENWGMVTYGEQYLLYDEEETTAAAKTTIATIIAHEFAHQWFGDLITPKWWTYTWLNEGFASLFEYVTTDEVYPEWDLMQAFVAEYLRSSLINDAQSNPRPMSAYAESPAGIAGLFNYVSYGKAGSVLRMFQHAFTEPTFQKALSAYQKQMRYQSATEDDLFQCFKDATYEDGIFNNNAVALDILLKTWTNQGGYPLITVTRDYSKGTFTIQQRPFDGTSSVGSTDKRTWWVPYNFATGSNPDFSSTNMAGYLSPNEQSAVVEQTAQKWTNDDWIVLNKQATSFYRVNYDAQNWALLANGLQADHKKIHKHNRAQLIEDAYRLILAEILEYDVLFELMSYLKSEEDYAPWANANSIFTTLDSYLAGDKEYRAYRFFVKRMAQNYFKTIGVDEKSSDAHLTRRIRGAIINLACRGNNAECLEASNKKLIQFAQYGNKIEANLRATITCTGMINGTEFDMNLMIQSLKTTEVQALRNNILQGLGCMRKVSLLKTYLKSIFDPASPLSNSEKLNILGYVVDKSVKGVEAAIEFLSENYQEYSKLSTTSDTVLLGVRSIALRIYTDERSALFETLLEKLKAAGNLDDTQLPSIRTMVTNNLAWTENNRHPIMSWMNKFYADNDGEKEEEEEEEEGGGNGGGGGDGAGSIIVSTGVLAFVAVSVLRTVL